MVEGGGGSLTTATFNVTRMGSTAEETKVDWVFVPGQGVDANDFVGGMPAGGTITFAQFDKIASVAVDLWIVGDDIAEFDETFQI